MNVTKISQLPQQTQDLLRNLSRLDPFIRTYGIQNKQMQKIKPNYIGFENLQIQFDIEYISYALSNNFTVKRLPNYPDCKNGKYGFNFKCREWYIEALTGESIKINKPGFYYQANVPRVTVVLCQKMFKYNSTLDSDILNHVFCAPVYLESLNESFRNFAKSSIQSYLIEPISQTVIFDSTKPFDKYSTKSLQDLELKYLQSQNEAQLFNNTLKSTFQSQIYERLEKINKNQPSQLSNQVLEFKYNRNGTKNYVTIHPIYLIDKLPQFIGVRKPNPKKYNIQIMFAQINIISNEFLEQSSFELQQFFNKYYLGYLIAFLCIAVVSLFFSIIYSIKMIRLFNNSINHLIHILEQIQLEQKNRMLHTIIVNNQFNSNLIFLSYETRELYQSIQSVFQFLLYIGENFFLENEAQTLLQLNKKIEFFKQFKNDYAVGISYNNIGSILLKQGHYFQALEHFQTAIMFAKYEIQRFLKINPESVSAKLMSEYSFENAQCNQLNPSKINGLSQSNSTIDEKKQRKINKNNSSDVTMSETDQKQKKSTIIKQYQIKQNNSSFENIYDQLISSCQGSKLINNKENLSNINNMNKVQNNLYPINMINNHTLEQISIEQREDLYQERVELISNLYYRQQNFITTLIAFQEYNDKSKNVCKIGFQCFNFWKEIKSLLKKQVILCQYVPFGNIENVELLALISKCQFNLNQQEKSAMNLKISEKILENLKVYSEAYNFFDQNGNIHQAEIQKLIINKQYEIKTHQSTQINFSNQLQNQFKKKYIKSHEKLNQTVKTDFEQSNNQHISRNILKVNQPKLFINFSDVNKSSSYQEKYHQSQQEKSQNTSLINTPLNTNNIICDLKFEDIENRVSTPQKDSENQLKLSHFDIINQIDEQQKLKSSFQNQKYSIFQFLQKNNMNNNLSNTFSKIFGTQQITECQKKTQLQKKQSQIPQNQYNTPKKSTQTPKKEYVNLSKQKRNTMELQPLCSLTSQLFNKSKNKSLQEQHHNRESNSFKNEREEFSCQNIFETKELLINYIKAEYFIKNKNYIQAALTLTSLLENNKILISHLPYKVSNQLKKIFNNCNIKSQELVEFNQKFNSNIQMQIAIIYSYKQEQNEKCLQSIQLLRDVVYQILTFKKDKIGIIIQNQEENILQFYMNFIKIPQIYDLIDHIISDIQESIYIQPVNYLQNQENNLLNLDNKIQKKDRLIQDSFNKFEQSVNLQIQTNFQNNSLLKNQENDKSKIIQNRNSFLVYSKQNENNNSIMFTQQNQYFQTFLTEQIHENQYEQSDFLLQNKNNSPNLTYTFIKQKSKSNSYIEQQSFVQQKIDQHKGEEDDQSLHRESLLDLNSQGIDIEQQNDLFYESIRQTLDKYFMNQIIFRNSKIKSYFNEYLRNNQIKYNKNTFNFQQLLKLTNNLKEQQSKYIVFATDQITIYKDSTFERMCQILYYLNAQLVVLSNEKGNSFIEQNIDTGYEYNEKIIIKVFYESSKIINYLKFQRDHLTKNIHPTYIQHY